MTTHDQAALRTAGKKKVWFQLQNNLRSEGFTLLCHLQLLLMTMPGYSLRVAGCMLFPCNPIVTL